MFMYLAFIIRLRMVYNNPFYSYNYTLLKIACIIIIAFALGIGIITSVDTHTYPYYSQRHKFITFCRSDIKPYIALMTGLYDIVFSIGSMIAFINPLRKIVSCILNETETERETELETENGVHQAGSKEDRNQKRDLKRARPKELYGIMNTGMEYAILTSIASFSTLLFMVAVAIGLLPVAPFDFVTNMACLLMMTPYYDERKYFQRICCGAILCSNGCLKCCYGYHKESTELGIQIVMHKQKSATKSNNGSGTASNESTRTNSNGREFCD